MPCGASCSSDGRTDPHRHCRHTRTRQSACLPVRSPTSTESALARKSSSANAVRSSRSGLSGHGVRKAVRSRTHLWAVAAYAANRGQRILVTMSVTLPVTLDIDPDRPKLRGAALLVSSLWVHGLLPQDPLLADAAVTHGGVPRAGVWGIHEAHAQSTSDRARQSERSSSATTGPTSGRRSLSTAPVKHRSRPLLSRLARTRSRRRTRPVPGCSFAPSHPPGQL